MINKLLGNINWTIIGITAICITEIIVLKNTEGWLLFVFYGIYIEE